MKNAVIESFIYEVVLIDPIKDIVNKLENNEFRDCDIKWLNDKLNKFTSFALETLDKTFELGEIGSTVMNDTIKSRFLNCFNTLLKYYKSMSDV